MLFVLSWVRGKEKSELRMDGANPTRLEIALWCFIASLVLQLRDETHLTTEFAGKSLK